jgi:hypothetical protein
MTVDDVDVFLPCLWCGFDDDFKVVTIGNLDGMPVARFERCRPAVATPIMAVISCRFWIPDAM